MPSAVSPIRLLSANLGMEAVVVFKKLYTASGRHSHSSAATRAFCGCSGA